jgi:hypothetical protein
MSEFFIGLSLGQMSESSALAIGECIPEGQGCHIRHLERFPVGESYPAIIKRLALLVGGEPAKPSPLRAGGCTLILDATAAGKPVVDLFSEATLPVGHIIGLSITGGDTETQEAAEWGNEWARVPKRSLVSLVQVMLQTGRLKIAPQLPDTAKLTRELQSFTLKQSEVTAEASSLLWREGAQDDYVFAIAIACWALLRGQSKLAGLFTPGFGVVGWTSNLW